MTVPLVRRILSRWPRFRNITLRLSREQKRKPDGGVDPESDDKFKNRHGSQRYTGHPQCSLHKQSTRDAPKHQQHQLKTPQCRTDRRVEERICRPAENRSAFGDDSSLSVKT